MEVVLGIGGLFFRARNPESLAAWYRELTRLVYADELGDLFAESWSCAGCS